MARMRRYRARPDINYQWGITDATTTISTSPASVLANLNSSLESDLGLELQNYTVERIRGQISISAPAGATAFDSVKVFLGITVLGNDAIAAGAVPEPYDDHVNWLWEYGAQLFVPDSPSATLATLLIPHHWSSPVVDIKARRRARMNHSSLVLVGYHDNGLGGTPNISINLKTLFRLR